MLIEDVACPVDKLGDMTQDLVDMFQKFGYKDASCFGHALEGNLHLVFSQVPPFLHTLLTLTFSESAFSVESVIWQKPLGSVALGSVASFPVAIIACHCCLLLLLPFV